MPPLENQIIQIVADPPVKGMQALGPVWVESTLEIVFSDIDMGRSCYRMKVCVMTPSFRAIAALY